MKKEYKSIKFDYNNMMATYVGEKEGFSIKDFKDNKKLVNSAFDFVSTNRRVHSTNFGKTQQKTEFKDYAALLRAKLKR